MRELLNILANEPIEELKKNLDECQDDINIKQNLITEAEFDIFFSDIFEEWNDLIQELYNYSNWNSYLYYYYLYY